MPIRRPTSASSAQQSRPSSSPRHATRHGRRAGSHGHKLNPVLAHASTICPSFPWPLTTGAVKVDKGGLTGCGAICKVPLDMAREREELPPAPADNEAFLAWLETVPDPERRYTIATSTLEEYQEMVSRLSALRAGAVADASEDDSVSSVARRFGVS